MTLIPLNVHISVIIRWIFILRSTIKWFGIDSYKCIRCLGYTYLFYGWHMDILESYIFIRIQICSLSFFLFYTNSKLHRKVNIHL